MHFLAQSRNTSCGCRGALVLFLILSARQYQVLCRLTLLLKSTMRLVLMVRGVLQGRFLRINGWSRAIARWHLPGAPVPCARTPCDSGRGTPSCYHAWALMARAAALSHDVSRNVLRLIR